MDQALNEAFGALTDENPKLQGLFRADCIGADALNDDRFGKLNKYDLDRENVPLDMLGEAYMDLMRHLPHIKVD